MKQQLTKITKLPMNDPADEAWFKEHPDREVRLRPAGLNELAEQFGVLDNHDPKRRMVLCWKVPANKGPYAGLILKMPFFKRADESITDTEAFGLKLLDQFMAFAKDDHEDRELYG